MDVKTSFLNGVIEEEVYIEQPEGFTFHGSNSHACQLKKALYGLKQALRAWYSKIDSYLQRLGITKSDVDSNLYFKVVGNIPLILVLYVDDLFLTGDENQIAQCKRELTSEFEMKDLGLMHYFLGLEMWQRSDEILLSQGKYTVDVLCRFGMMNCKSITKPMLSNLKKIHETTFGIDPVDSTMYKQLIGSLLHLVHMRPDICFAISALSQFMLDPRYVHWVVAKHVLKYLCGVIGYGLRYTSVGGVRLSSYIDSDCVGSAVDQKNASRYFFSMGSAMISWSSRKQSSITLSTVEAEYITASDASKEAICLCKLLAGLFGDVLETTIIHCDNQSCVKLSKKPIFHDRSKNIEMQYHYLQVMVHKGAIRLQYILTNVKIDDVFTKPLFAVKFVYFRDKLSMAENASLAEREC